MSTQTAQATDVRFKVAWWVMAVLAAVSIVNHLMLMFVEDEPVLFLGWAIFNLYAIVVLVVPFRRGETWAWNASWLFVVPYVSLIAFDSQVGPFYGVAGAIFAACLLVTRNAFPRVPRSDHRSRSGVPPNGG